MRPIRLPPPLSAVFFSPKIYLPWAGPPRTGPTSLLHEQAHLRRRDHLTKPLAWLALCLHWCNPFSGWPTACSAGIWTACDQAVIRRFGAKDTAQYAAALLHLGHSGKLPQAVPLAFGEEDPKGRIRHVLDYKRPPVWVAGIAAGVCGHHRLILANPRGTGGPDGRGRHHRDLPPAARHPVRLPENSRHPWSPFFGDYDQEDYTPLAQFSLPNGALLPHQRQPGTQFCLFFGETGAPVLVRLNHDGYSASQRRWSSGNPSSRTPGGAFQTSLSSYLREGWAEDLYALKTPIWAAPLGLPGHSGGTAPLPGSGPLPDRPADGTRSYGITLQFQGSLSPRRPSPLPRNTFASAAPSSSPGGQWDRFSWELPWKGRTPCPGHRGKKHHGTPPLTAFLPAWQQALEEWLQESPLFQTTRPGEGPAPVVPCP